MQQTGRSYSLDMLKGMAIVAVILFHAGIFNYGYLGVEVFLVIAGYLTTKSIIKQYDNNKFSYWHFLVARIVRLWPLVLSVSMVSLVIGYFTMLPTNYKNTAETALGSSIFLNNFIQYITAGDYWDAANEYKPLMHTWYVGLIFQFYLLFPLFFMATHRFSKDWKHALIVVLSVVGLSSLALYALSFFSTAFNFYMLPSRLFEFTAGGLLAIPISSEQNKVRWWYWNGLLILTLLMIVNANLDATQYRLLLTVMVTTLLISLTKANKSISALIPNIKPIALLGMASYSLYLWHQVILAFYRNIWNDQLDIWEYILIIGLSIAVGIISYYGFEKTVDRLGKKDNKGIVLILSICTASMLPLGYFSAKYYRHEGVVRDVPELEVFAEKPDTWIPQAYNAAVYSQDHDFPDNGRKNVLVVGDSYARDWYNVIKESNCNENINLSYHEKPDAALGERIEKADYVFLATHGAYDRFDNYLPQMMEKVFYRVGDKRFFSSPNIVYNRRNSTEYFRQKVDIPKDIAESNRKEQRIFGKSFINAMDVMKDDSGRYDIFTPEHLLISHDGLHLTKAGAKYYAKKMNVTHLFKNQDHEAK